MKIVIFCHVESGTSRSKELIFHPDHEEGVSVAVPRIVEFADEHELPLVFAMTPAALRDSETDLKGYEVGIHLHPQDDVLRRKLLGEVTLSSDCLSGYSPHDQKSLIEAAKRSFEEVQGGSPRTFVAGRWSENTTTVKLLAAADFSFDGSPLPGHVSRCADWSRIPRLAQPYRPSSEDYQRRGTMSLLHVPVYQGLWNHYLTPECIHLVGASYFKAAIKEAVVGEADVVHMFFHSAMAVDPTFLSEFESVVSFAQDEPGVRFALPSELGPSEKPSSKPFPPAYFAFMNRRMMKSLVGRGELGRQLMASKVSDAKTGTGLRGHGQRGP